MSSAFSLAPSQPPRLSIADYHRLIHAQQIAESNHWELLRGELVEKAANNPSHAGTIGMVQGMLHDLLPSAHTVRTQLPVTLSDSEPEPDLAIVRGDLIDFIKRHPGPQETPLVIEVAATSLLTDRFKAEIYAEAGIPWYWIVNLVARRVEVYSQPTSTAAGMRYGEPTLYLPGDIIPVIVGGREIGSIAADKLLPVVSE